MFYLPLAVATWLGSIWVIHWRRIRELLVYGLLGGLIASIENTLGYLYGWWEYHDVGPIDQHFEIAALIEVGVAPLFAMWFVQELSCAAVPWRRIAVVVLVSMVPETVGLATRNITYGNGWNYAHSVLAHLPTWLALCGLHWFYRQKERA